MDLILWRHAEAEEGSNDLKRALTSKGKVQAKSMAKWLKKHLPQDYVIWVSEARRSQQTALALSSSFDIHPELNPDASIQDILPNLYATHWASNMLIVGHQPWIGRLCARLMSDDQYSKMGWSVKKSAVFWFDVKYDQDSLAVKLKAVMSPGFL